MYDTFYKLGSDPFCLSPDHRFCYRHRSFSKARAYLHFALQRAEGFVMVTGAPGTGKTTLVNQLTSEAQTAHVTVAHLHTTQLGADDLLQMAAYAFRQNFEGRGKAYLLHQLEIFLQQQHRAKHRAVLIIDEAQDLSFGALEEVRLLTNIDLDGRPLLQVFLVGQDQLQTQLNSPELPQLQQRIIAHAHLEPMTDEESATYITHRLRVAGWSGDPQLDDEAILEIVAFSHGVPRRINQLCSRLLLFGMVEEKHRLDGDDVRSVLGELHEERLLPDADEELLATRSDPARGARAASSAREPTHNTFKRRDEDIGTIADSASGSLRHAATPATEPLRPLQDSAGRDLPAGGTATALHMETSPIAPKSVGTVSATPVVHVASALAHKVDAVPNVETAPRRVAQVHELRPPRVPTPLEPTEPLESSAAANRTDAIENALSRARFRRRVRHQWAFAVFLVACVLSAALYSVRIDMTEPPPPGIALARINAALDTGGAHRVPPQTESASHDDPTAHDASRGDVQVIGARLRRRGLTLTPNDGGFAIDPGVAATFAFRSAAINGALRETLDRIVAETRESNDVFIRVTGHADAIGSMTANRHISQDRADNVVGYLKEHGISPSRLQAQARGSDQLKSATQQSMNRCVEIFVEPARDAAP